MTFSGIFWEFVVLAILAKLNISLAAAFLFVVAISVAFKIYEYFGRKSNPEKWKKIDKEMKEREQTRAKEAEMEEEKNRPRVAEKYYMEYEAAMERIPKSEWILMDRAEKSTVFRRRERLKEYFYSLPHKTQVLIKNKYSINTSFPGSE